jgi:hypothetical protein
MSEESGVRFSAGARVNVSSTKVETVTDAYPSCCSVGKRKGKVYPRTGYEDPYEE